MDQPSIFEHPEDVALEMDAEVQALPLRNTPNTRAIRRKYSRMLKEASPEFMLDVTRTLRREYGYWGFAYEVIANHQGAFQ